MKGPQKSLRVPHHLQIQSLHPLSGPRGFSQKSQARLDRRIVGKAADGNPLTELFPTIVRYQLLQNGVETKSVKGIVGLMFQ
jgi:hypothetical protein